MDNFNFYSMDVIFLDGTVSFVKKFVACYINSSELVVTKACCSCHFYDTSEITDTETKIVFNDQVSLPQTVLHRNYIVVERHNYNDQWLIGTVK